MGWCRWMKSLLMEDKVQLSYFVITMGIGDSLIC